MHIRGGGILYHGGEWEKTFSSHCTFKEDLRGAAATTQLNIPFMRSDVTF